MYHKRIVCDIDDTISFCDNRDWSNAKPNLPVIQKLKSMYNDGWEIYLHTARGSLSAKNPKDAEEKYGDTITKWMQIHEVPYHKLVFGKPLGAYYVDDKAITPDDFVSLEIEQLKGGLSGADVYRAGDVVHKTADNTPSVVQWYKISKSSSLETPKVLKVVGQTISLEYINDNTDIDCEVVTRQLESNKNYLHHEIPDFSTYINRVKSHGLDTKYLSVMNKHSYFFNNHKSFCHGDASIDNILCRDKTTYYIDPIYLPDMYSSWLLDISKFLTSLKRCGNMKTYNMIIEKYHSIKHELQVLEMSHWIRMYKYHTSKDYVMKQIEDIYELTRD